MKRRAKPRKLSTRPGKKPRRSAKISHAAPAGMPHLGLESAVQRVLPREWTIAAFDPRLPAVLSTPAMIGMMEIAAAQAVQPELPAGAITVGTRIEVDHLKAVTEGATVRAAARLVGYQGRFLVFEVEARSGDLLLGSGKVHRAIIEPHTFNARATARKDSWNPSVERRHRPC
jgi:fluoroacetyl-CoA thioesterase